MRRFLKNLFASKTQQARTPKSFAPEVESLAERLCPAGVSLKGQTLSIIGTDSAERVSVLQNDNGRTVLVDYNGAQSEFNSGDIKKISIDLKGGDDRLFYGVDQNGAYYLGKQLAITMGAGNDDVEISLNAAISANLAISVNAGTGNDELVASFGPKVGGKLSLKALMGVGSDAAAVYFAGVSNNAQATIDVDGGSGSDALDFIGSMSSVDSGKLTAKLKGGVDNDNLEFVLNDASAGRVKAVAQANGGKGKDVVSATANVKLTGCEDVTPFYRPPFLVNLVNTNIDFAGNGMVAG